MPAPKLPTTTIIGATLLATHNLALDKVNCASRLPEINRMAPAEGPPLSLRPFPVADKNPKNLSDFISRVNALPGGFRAVTESKLEEEIRARRDANPEDNGEDVDMSEGDDAEDADAKDPNLARMEVLKNIE